MPNQKNRRRDLIVMAVRLRERLLATRTHEVPLFPESSWRMYQRLARLSEKATERGWLAAAERIRPKQEKALGDFQEALTRMQAEQNRHGPAACPSLRELHAEVLGLCEEFADVECDLRARTISVITEAIVLEEVPLGPFRIELDLGAAGERLSYSVIATDPQPAANDENVTHPHVRDDCLCEGEGTLPIRRALEEGRLVDFFQLVSQILQTYNSGSPYIPLEDWQGISCVSCGDFLNEDERTNCSRTSDPLCCQCAVTCPDCENDFAPDLLERCETCDENYCDNCLEKGMCHDCREKNREAEEAQAERQAETPSGRRGGDAAGVEQTEAVGPAIG